MTTRLQTRIVVLARDGKHLSCLAPLFTFAVGEAGGESDVTELAEEVGKRGGAIAIVVPEQGTS